MRSLIVVDSILELRRESVFFRLTGRSTFLREAAYSVHEVESIRTQRDKYRDICPRTIRPRAVGG